MSIKDELANLGNSEQAKVAKKSVPTGFEPKLDYDPAIGGTLVTKPRLASDGEPDHAELFKEFGLDPNKWRIQSLRVGKWQRWDEEWLESYRAQFVPYNGNGLVSDDELCEIVAKWKPRNSPKKPVKGSVGGLAYVVVLADTQIGKSDNGGSEAIVERVLQKIDDAVIRLKELRKLGRQIDVIYLPQLGDCIEGAVSQGSKLMFRLDLDVTQQIRIYRRLLLHMVKVFAPLADQVIVPAVGGNHDEAVRVGNQMATTYTDSFALDAASAVQDALADHPDFQHVKFVFPEYDRLTVTLDMCGTIVGMTHGHQCRGKAVDWWAKQAHGQQVIGAATLLLTGHYHHLKVEQSGAKTWIQAPALDDGSIWFEHTSGQSAPAGMLTLTVGAGGWSDLQVL